jgi:hypothetical protein
MLTWSLAEAKPVFPHGSLLSPEPPASPETPANRILADPSIMISCDASEQATEVGDLQVFQASDGLEPSTPSLPSSNEAGTAGKAGKSRARKTSKNEDSSEGA